MASKNKLGAMAKSLGGTKMTFEQWNLLAEVADDLSEAAAQRLGTLVSGLFCIAPDDQARELMQMLRPANGYYEHDETESL